MTQAEFDTAYPQRVKGADVVPDVSTYVNNVFGQKTYGDTAVNPEDIRPERDGLHGEPEAKPNMNAPGKFVCEYCGKDDIKARVGLMSHMRACKKKRA